MKRALVGVRDGLFNTLAGMSHPAALPPPCDRLVSFFRRGDAMRSRSVSTIVLTGTVDIPPPPARLLADWERETGERLGLEPGDVEQLPLARARVRWPDYRRCVQAVADWAGSVGLQEVPGTSDVALMACRGTRYHHDAEHYGSAAFCNLFVSDDKGLDLHFPAIGQHIALERGTVVVFDTGQPHAVVDRRRGGFALADFPPGRDCSQVFLTWELPIEQTPVERVLGIRFDIKTATAALLTQEQVWWDGARASVCPDTGKWR